MSVWPFVCLSLKAEPSSCLFIGERGKLRSLQSKCCSLKNFQCETGKSLNFGGVRDNESLIYHTEITGNLKHYFTQAGKEQLSFINIYLCPLKRSKTCPITFYLDKAFQGLRERPINMFLPIRDCITFIDFLS